MAKNSKLVLLRLQKQESKLKADPIEQAWVARQGVLNFHFCLHGLSSPYEGGFYHGLLKLSEEYPFAPPQLMFFTPSGRFEVGKAICTSFTNYHRQTWTSSWNVRTMIIATISFMQSQDTGAGYMNSSSLTRRHYARESMAFNLRNPLFKELFKRNLNEGQLNRPLTSQQNKKESSSAQISQIQKPQQSYAIYGLYLLLGIIVVGWVMVKGS